MNTSSDIKALFDRFGGDATSYREIRMENEAQEARDRWPLLGMIDPRRVEVSVAGKSRDPTPAGTGDTKGPGPVAESAPGTVSSGGGSSPLDRSQAALRRSAPLFTRSPRRDMAQAIEKAAQTAPESGALRFSPPPGEQAAWQGAMPPVPDETVAAPRNFDVPPLAENIPPAVAAPAASPVSSAQPTVARGGAPLRKLFGAAAASAMQQVAADAPPAGVAGHLDQLFDRLRESSNSEPVQGGSADPKTAPAPARPWLSKGVNGP